MKLVQLTKILLIMALPALAHAESFNLNVMCSSAGSAGTLLIEGGDILRPDTADIRFAGDPTGTSHAQFLVLQKTPESTTYQFTWAPQWNPNIQLVTLLELHRDGTGTGVTYLPDGQGGIQHVCQSTGPISPLPTATFGN